MKIVVASGKGGTGKSMIAANLAFALARDRDVTIVDCDVEEPNLSLFFPAEAESTPVEIPVPAFDSDLCTHCGECGKFCRYGAITVLKDRVLFMQELCHACGGCTLVCPEGAVSERTRCIGRVECSAPLDHLRLISGVMNVGEVMAPKVIRAAKAEADDDPLIILDAPPGSACPVVETIEGCDFCILVAEPTPFGLHDLRLVVDTARLLGVPAGVVINKATGDAAALRHYCDEEGLPVIMTIPLERGIAQVQNRARLISQDLPGWCERFGTLFYSVQQCMEGPQ